MKKVPDPEYPRFLKITNLYFLNPVLNVNPSSLYPIIYTDGSKMPLGTALAFTVFYSGRFIYNYSAKLHKLNPIYKAELLAIYKAIEWFMSTNFSAVLLYTDSILILRL